MPVRPMCTPAGPGKGPGSRQGLLEGNPHSPRVWKRADTQPVKGYTPGLWGLLRPGGGNGRARVLPKGGADKGTPCFTHVGNSQLRWLLAE